MSVTEAIHIIDECLESLDYIGAICILWGLPASKIPNHIELGIELLERKAYFQQMLDEAKHRRKRVTLLNEKQVLSSLREVLESTNEDKLAWKNGPIKVICSDEELMSLASKVKNGNALTFKKDEASRYFDFTSVIPFWHQIPNYTLLLVGGGLAFSSPEYDLFQSMCWFSDEATRTYAELQETRKNIGSSDFDEETFFRKRSVHRFMCSQTVVNSFLVLEAYLNSIAHLRLADTTRSLSEEDQRYLREQTMDKHGNVRQKFVSIEDKLYEWVRIISPRSETFDKGRKPFQDFRKLKAYRDAIVHLSESKVPTYNSINFDVCRQAVNTVIEIVEKIGDYIAVSLGSSQPAWWLCRPDDNGFFNLPSKFPLPAIP